ncbi:MAG: cytochrome c-type biogenesis protein CcmH [Syntrophothermus sp.]
MRSVIGKIMVIFAVLLVVAQAPAALASTPESKAVESNLICQCGCTMVVDVCDCGTADQIRADIQKKLDQGMTKDQILASYVKTYGEKVLAAPTKKGFNLTAWVTPFVAILLGAAVIFLAIRRWVVTFRGQESAEAGDTADNSEDLRKYSEKLQAELKDYM